MELVTPPAHGAVFSNPDYEDHDCLEDRRLSDVLPIEVVRQIGLDPSAYLFEQHGRRRNTDPVPAQPDSIHFFQRRSTSLERATRPAPSALYPLTGMIPPPVAGWFIVELSDGRVPAFSIAPVVPPGVGRVIIRDGRCYRIGRIIEQIHEPVNLTRSSPQIWSFDKDSELADYLSAETQIAQAMAPAFMKFSGCKARLLGIELVSLDLRALFWVRVSRLDDPNLAGFARCLIQTFATAVEFFA
jgi:hypothetical protein